MLVSWPRLYCICFIAQCVGCSGLHHRIDARIDAIAAGHHRNPGASCLDAHDIDEVLGRRRHSPVGSRDERSSARTVEL